MTICIQLRLPCTAEGFAVKGFAVTVPSRTVRILHAPADVVVADDAVADDAVADVIFAGNRNPVMRYLS